MLSDAERRATYDRYGFEGLESRGYASAAHGFGSFADIFDAFFGGDPFGAGFGGGAGRVQGGDVGVEVEITLEQAARGDSVEVAYDLVDACERCHGNRAEPGTPIETCSRCDGAGPRARGHAHGLRPARARAGLRRLRRRGQDPDAALRGVRRARPQGGAQDADGRRARPGSPTSSASASPAAATPASAAGRPATSTCSCGVAEDERFVRDGSDLVTVVDVPAPAAALGATVTRGRRSTATRSVDVPAGTQPGTVVTLRGHGMPALGRGRRGDQRVVLNVVIPRNLTRAPARAARRAARTRSPRRTWPSRATSRCWPRSGGRSADPARGPRARGRRRAGAGGAARAGARGRGAGGRRRLRRVRASTARRESCRRSREGEAEVGGVRVRGERRGGGRTTGPSAGSAFHRAGARSAAALRVRPPWEPPRRSAGRRSTW